MSHGIYAQAYKAKSHQPTPGVRFLIKSIDGFHKLR
ncbi:hypothetical protein [Caudoviricetes sp.]|nr:hypothetical protein [Caudoviricetes sp.]